MPDKKSNNGDYFEDNLSKLYELENKRRELDEMAENLMKEGKSLSDNEMLKQSESIQRIINEQSLAELLEKAKENEDENKDGK